MKSKNLSQDEIEYLLSLEKVVIDKGNRSLYEEIDFNKQSSYRFSMVLKDDVTDTVRFFLQIRRSEKNTVQLTLHFQELSQNTCILRIDFNPGAPHANPTVAEGYPVPDMLSKYAGTSLTGSHIHYNVEGYRIGAWAIPIEDSGFPVNNFLEDNYVDSFNQIMNAFKEKINLETIIVHQNVIPI